MVDSAADVSFLTTACAEYLKLPVTPDVKEYRNADGTPFIALPVLSQSRRFASDASQFPIYVFVLLSWRVSANRALG